MAEGNEFSLLLPLKKRTYESCDAIDVDIDCTLLEDCVVTLGGVEYTPSLGTDGVRITVPSTLARGTYDLVLTATYEESEIRAAFENAVSIVKWSKQSDAEQYLPGSPIVCNPAYVIGGSLTDEEVEQLKQDLQARIDDYDEAIEAAEEAKETWEDKAAALDDVASEANATSNKQAVLDAISAAITALQGGDATATIAALKTAIANINIDTTELAKQGSDSSVSLTTIDAKLGEYVQATSEEEEAALEDLDEQLENI